MTIYYEDAGLRLWHGSNLDLLPTFEDASFDSNVTDPPYELGFMGKGWDSTGIAYNVDVWRECLRVLKPGGHLLAFGGTRTWHRIAVAIEDAGFEIRDSIAWLYGSGFPKSLDVSKAIDKGSGENRERQLEFTAWMRSTGITAAQIAEATGTAMASHFLTAKSQPAIATADLFDKLRPLLPEVPERIERLVAERTGSEWSNWASREVTGQHEKPAAAQEWRARIVGGDVAPARERRDRAFTEEAKAWEGWGTALKPAFEPVVVARKPLAGTVAANVLAHGTGALNIDATRVAHRNAADLEESTKKNRHADFGTAAGGNAVYGDYSMVEVKNYDGAAGRWPTNVILDGSQADALDEQSGHLRDGVAVKRNGVTSNGVTGWGKAAPGTADVAKGDGQGGGASRFFPTFRYEAKAPTSERPNVDGTVHATVKPLELMRWLIRLVTRPGGRVLDPFAGSGTTGEAALLEGMEVDLIELEADHLPLILQRIRKPLQPSMFGDWEGGAA